MRLNLAGILAALLMLLNCAPRMAHAATEMEELRAEVAKLREAVNASRASAAAPMSSAVDTMMDNKYGPDANVTTRAGKLTIGGLVQAWYFTREKDSRGLFDNAGGTGVLDSNAASNSSSFRIRRAELRLSMDIHDNVRAYVMIDPAAEASSFPQLGVANKRLANVSPEFDAVNGPTLGTTTSAISAVQQGSGTVPRLLQDALINFHGVIPHHDMTVGQMKTTFNEENLVLNGNTDFAERSFIAQQNTRDIGAVLHGSWWCSDRAGGAYQGTGDSGRLQYWVGTFNSPGNLFGSAGPAFNRSDDNDSKDIVATMMLRPIWDDCWGKLELGYSFRGGRHGDSGTGQQATAPVNGLDRKKTWSMGHDAWAKYEAPGPLKGLWLKGEGQWLRDRNAPGAAIDLVANDFQLGDGGGNADQANVFHTFGYWGAIGYRLSDSPLFCNSDCSIWKNFELAFRYEHAPNVTIADPANAFRTSVYSSKIYTPGVNYYIKGNYAKIQVNYNFVKNPSGPLVAPFHNTRNDSLIVNFQVQW